MSCACHCSIFWPCVFCLKWNHLCLSTATHTYPQPHTQAPSKHPHHTVPHTQTHDAYTHAHLPHIPRNAVHTQPATHTHTESFHTHPRFPHTRNKHNPKHIRLPQKPKTHIHNSTHRILFTHTIHKTFPHSRTHPTHTKNPLSHTDMYNHTHTRTHTRVPPLLGVPYHLGSRGTSPGVKYVTASFLLLRFAQNSPGVRALSPRDSKGPVVGTSMAHFITRLEGTKDTEEGPHGPTPTGFVYPLPKVNVCTGSDFKTTNKQLENKFGRI